jgi:hypothetical protein
MSTKTTSGAMMSQRGEKLKRGRVKVMVLSIGGGFMISWENFLRVAW